MTADVLEGEAERRRRVGDGGKRLDRSRDAVILRAALDGLAEVGYDRLTMDLIAAKAHAGKGALYRRWPSKAALVVDAVVRWREQFAPTLLEDTGSLRGDIDALIASVVHHEDADQQQIAVFLGLASAAIRDRQLKALLADHVLEVPRRVISTILQRAVARDEIAADRLLDLVPDLVVGLNVVQSITGRGSERAYVRRVFDEIVIPLVSIRSAPIATLSEESDHR